MKKPTLIIGKKTYHYDLPDAYACGCGLHKLCGVTENIRK